MGKRAEKDGLIAKCHRLRFETCLKPVNGLDCLLWVGPVRNDGSPIFRYQGCAYAPTDIAFFLLNGRWPTGSKMYRTCKNNGCVADRHLLEGTEENSFWSKVRFHPDHCWLWDGTKTEAGYGQFKTKDGVCFPHRYILENTDTKQVVLHTCDTPLCVRPDHLKVGTTKENVWDAIQKGRRPQVGANCNFAKLTSEEMSNLKRDIKENSLTYKELAVRYGISTSYVNVLKRKLGLTTPPPAQVGCYPWVTAKEFWSRANIGSADICWDWKGKTENSHGYGQFSGNSAHRIAFWLHNGDIPAGSKVRHSCHNRKCVNPKHLSLGTDLDNTRDKVNAKRHTFGGAVKNAILSSNDVHSIRAAKGVSGRSLAKTFGVTEHTITGIRSGRCRKND